MDFHLLSFPTYRECPVTVCHDLSKDPLKIPTPLSSRRAQLDFRICVHVSVWRIHLLRWSLPSTESTWYPLSLSELFHLA